MLPVVRHHVRILLTFAVLLAGLSTPWIGQAQGQSGVTITARAGFDGYYEINQLTRVSSHPNSAERCRVG